MRVTRGFVAAIQMKLHFALWKLEINKSSKCYGTLLMNAEGIKRGHWADLLSINKNNDRYYSIDVIVDPPLAGIGKCNYKKLQTDRSLCIFDIMRSGETNNYE